MVLGPNGEEIEVVYDEEPHRFGHFRIPAGAVLATGDFPTSPSPYPFIDANFDMRKEDAETRLDRGRKIK